jgi:hypothetical protein
MWWPQEEGDTVADVTFSPNSISDLENIRHYDGENEMNYVVDECLSLEHAANRIQADRLAGNDELFKLVRRQYNILFRQLQAATDIVRVERVRNRYRAYP